MARPPLSRISTAWIIYWPPSTLVPTVSACPSGGSSSRKARRQIYQIDRLKETVRLAAGLDADKRLSARRGGTAPSKCWNGSAKRLRSFHPSRVRAVATNTFRVARNTAEFLPRAESALGFPIEVIAGREEARLIFRAWCTPCRLPRTSGW